MFAVHNNRVFFARRENGRVQIARNFNEAILTSTTPLGGKYKPVPGERNKYRAVTPAYTDGPDDIELLEGEWPVGLKANGLKLELKDFVPVAQGIYERLVANLGWEATRRPMAQLSNASCGIEFQRAGLPWLTEDEFTKLGELIFDLKFKQVAATNVIEDPLAKAKRAARATGPAKKAEPETEKSESKPETDAG